MTDSPAAPPQTHDEVQTRYRELRRTHQHVSDALVSRRSRALQSLVAVAVLIAGVTASHLRPSLEAWLLIAGFAAAIWIIWYALGVGNSLGRQQRLVALYDANLLRSEGAGAPDPIQPARTGEDLRQPGHLYERDLDLLGPDSLFALLNTVRTGPGERGLAHLLLDPATHAETLERQEAVRELLPQLHLRESIALLGASRFQQITAGFFDEWLAATPPVFHPAFRFALLLTALAAVALLGTGILRLRPWGDLLPNLAVVLAVQGLITLFLRRRVMPLLQASVRLQQHVKLFSEGLALLQGASFVSPRLRALQRLALEPAGAVKLLARLDHQLAILEQRPKEYFLLLSLLLAAGTQAVISIAAWKRSHAGSMKLWLTAWSEFEALNALATYAFEHPVAVEGDGHNAWPELLPDSHPPLLEARGLGHPLLASSVTNRVALAAAAVESGNSRFLLISGSNMAGKSTLLRSIGINAVLAYAGAPVRASSMRLTPLALGASLALTDSLAEGKSKFLAEVQRLSSIVAQSRRGPTLFLVDEIFSGTNSLDRRTAAAAVLDSLLAHGAIGALSTHDLALTGLATPGNGGLNVHMASPDPDDPLAFDYKLKPGINTSSNALAIVRMMGLNP